VQFMQNMERGQQTFAEQQAEARGNERVDQLIADDPIAKDLSDKAKPLVRPLAEQLLPRYAEQYGFGPRAAALAVQQASRMVGELVADAKGLGAGETTEHLNNLAGARRELGVAGGAGQGLAESQDPHEITRRYASRARGLSAAV
jgi:hypothetical protein